MKGENYKVREDQDFSPTQKIKPKPRLSRMRKWGWTNQSKILFVTSACFVNCFFFFFIWRLLVVVGNKGLFFIDKLERVHIFRQKIVAYECFVLTFFASIYLDYPYDFNLFVFCFIGEYAIYVGFYMAVTMLKICICLRYKKIFDSSINVDDHAKSSKTSNFVY